MRGNGPLQKEDLYEVWLASVDRGYSEPFERMGEGDGLEVHTQAMVQLARVSTAVDVTTQAMYLRPFSGQTNSCAQGEAKSVVTLTITRPKPVYNNRVVLTAGKVSIEEYQEDWGVSGPELVRTGRKYNLISDVVFEANQVGPITVQAEADRPGWGYNNPLPGKIRYITQTGDSLNNDKGSIVAPVLANQGSGAISLPLPLTYGNQAVVARMYTKATPDMFIPESVGQYVTFSAGPNAGKSARILAYYAPTPGALFATGGTSVDLALEVTLRCVTSSLTGGFKVGEYITCTFGGFTGVYILESKSADTDLQTVITLQFVEGSQLPLIGGHTLVGSTSGAAITIETVLQSNFLATESSTATWRVLTWAADLGLVATNKLSPTGGRLGFLDMLGAERGVYRSQSESDESYRDRILNSGDVVTPAALNRAIIRAIGQTPYCLHEPGDSEFPGSFYDGDESAPSATPHGLVNNYYDTNVFTFRVPNAALFTYNSLPQSNTGINRIAILDATSGNIVAEGYHAGKVVIPGSSTHFGVCVTFYNDPLLVENTGGPFTENYTLYFPSTGPSQSGQSIVATQVHAIPSKGTTFPGPLARRNQTFLSIENFRGVFIVCLPHLNKGDFGMFYGAGKDEFYDANVHNFYDGFAAESSITVGKLRNSLNYTKAGGVGFEICVDDTCT